jgi:sn-glycerol 3-phosphate transport system substrate-binding protein
MKTMTAISAALAASLTAASANAATEISWWHAMGGRLGEIVDEFTVKFNASQDACVLTSTTTPRP